MPKATVAKDRDPESGKNDISSSAELGKRMVDAEAQAFPVEQRP
jgi:hypothetical protein